MIVPYVFWFISSELNRLEDNSSLCLISGIRDRDDDDDDDDDDDGDDDDGGDDNDDDDDDDDDCRLVVHSRKEKDWRRYWRKKDSGFSKQLRER